MNLPGFTAEASLGLASQSYRLSAAHGRQLSQVAPAQVDLFILEPFPSDESSAGADSPEDVCRWLRRCCNEGVVQCCIDYEKSCK